MEKSVHKDFAQYLQSFARNAELVFYRACRIDIQPFIQKYRKVHGKSPQDPLHDAKFVLPWLVAYESDLFTDVYNGMVDATTRSDRATFLLQEFEPWFQKLKPHSPLCILVFMFVSCVSYHRHLRRETLCCGAATESEGKYEVWISTQFSKFALETENDYCNKRCNQVYCGNIIPPELGREIFSMPGRIFMK